MRNPSAAKASLLVALSAGSFLAEAALERIIVDELGTIFKVDSWDDGRANPYEVSFREGSVCSDYTFGALGRLEVLQVDDAVLYTFEPDTTAINNDGTAASVKALQSPSASSKTGSRMLLSSQEIEDVADADHRVYACADCEETWDTLCQVGLVDVCYWAGLLPDVFTEDAKQSLVTMCDKFGEACMATAFATCTGQCAQNECNPNPCQNGGSCSSDPAGGHVCSCPSGYGGTACQTDTTSLDEFYIEIEYIGTWTDSRKAVFRSAADRWEEVVTHVPCGGSLANPAGRLLIAATMDTIDGIGMVLGNAGPTYNWAECPSISSRGFMTFDIDDIDAIEDNGTFEGVILHEMGHVIGVGTLWGARFAACTTCLTSADPAWTCPAALNAYYDLGGSDANIVELDGGPGTTCGHLDEVIFGDEVMTGYVAFVMPLSKMTAAVLEDIQYIVDADMVDPYTLPSERDPSIQAESTPLLVLNDVAVETLIFATDGDGNVVEEIPGIIMQF